MQKPSLPQSPRKSPPDVLALAKSADGFDRADRAIDCYGPARWNADLLGSVASMLVTQPFRDATDLFIELHTVCGTFDVAKQAMLEKTIEQLEITGDGSNMLRFCAIGYCAQAPALIAEALSHTFYTPSAAGANRIDVCLGYVFGQEGVSTVIRLREILLDVDLRTVN